MNSLLRLLLGAFAGSGVSTGAANSEPAPKEGFESVTKLTFEETVAQMSRGYENTQRVIQFMDAKAGAVVALSLAILAFVGKVTAWAYEKTDAEALWHLPCWLQIFGILFGLGVCVSCFCCIREAFKTVRPNGLPSKEAFSMLFPAHDGADGRTNAVNYLSVVASGTTQGFAIDEFKRQLVAVGGIVYNKIMWLRDSIWWLLWQGVTALVLGILIVWAAVSGVLIKTPVSVTDPAPVKVAASVVVASPVVISAPSVASPEVVPVPKTVIAPGNSP
jgi:uncharacterized membrane protein YhdT